jgi:hypothetical protein
MSALWRMLSTAATPWSHSPTLVDWEHGDFALGTPAGTGAQHSALLKSTLAEYYPHSVYMKASDLQAQIAGGTTGLSLPPSYVPPARTSPGGTGDASIAFSGSLAAWRADLGPWRAPTEHVSLSVGRHQVTFKHVANSIAPATALLDVSASGGSLSTTYAPSHGLWKVAPCANGYCYATGVKSMFADTHGGLVIFGDFTSIDNVSAKYAARWDGTQWNALGAGLDTSPDKAASIYAGSPVAAGILDSNKLECVASFNGSAWTPLGGGADRIFRILAPYGTSLAAGGEFSQIGSVPMSHIAIWNGSAWNALGAGTDAPIYALTVYKGALYATGDFLQAGGAAASKIASWDGSSWSALGSGLGGVGLPNGRSLDVWNSKPVVGGHFTPAGNQSARRVATWDGSTWSPVGDGLQNWVEFFAVYNGNLVAGGYFNNSSESGGPAGIGVWAPGP